MPETGRDRAQIGAVIQEMGGKRVSQDVRKSPNSRARSDSANYHVKMTDGHPLQPLWTFKPVFLEPSPNLFRRAASGFA